MEIRHILHFERLYLPHRIHACACKALVYCCAICPDVTRPGPGVGEEGVVGGS